MLDNGFRGGGDRRPLEKCCIFDNVITILLGRNNDCDLKLPNDDTTVRYHCLLDINPLSDPPQIQIRDFGGTYAFMPRQQVLDFKYSN